MKIPTEYKWAIVLAFVATIPVLWVLANYRLSTGIIYLGFLMVVLFGYIYWRTIVGKRKK